jgi:hypothetical protein
MVDAAIMVEDKNKAACESRKRRMISQGGPSNQRSRSMPPSRSAPPPQRFASQAPRPNNPNRQYQSNRPASGNPSGGNRNILNPTNHSQGSGCYTYGQPGHYSKECPLKKPSAPSLSTSRPNQGQGRGPTGKNPKTQANNARGRLNHVTAEEAAEAPDVVLGTFLVNSVPAKVLFDSGALHSFYREVRGQGWFDRIPNDSQYDSSNSRFPSKSTLDLRRGTHSYPWGILPSSSWHPAGEGNRHRRSSSSPCLPLE